MFYSFTSKTKKFMRNDYVFNENEWRRHIDKSIKRWNCCYRHVFHILSKIGKFGKYYFKLIEVHLNVPNDDYEEFRKMGPEGRTKHLLETLKMHKANSKVKIKTHSAMFCKETFYKHGIDVNDKKILRIYKMSPSRRQNYLFLHIPYIKKDDLYTYKFFMKFINWEEWELTINVNDIKI